MSKPKDPCTKAALERLNQIKSQLNLSSSPMALQAPKDMARERQLCEFDIQKLAILWAGGEKRYKYMKKAYESLENDPEMIVQPPRNILEMKRDEIREFTTGQINRMVHILRNLKDKEFAEHLLAASYIYSESFGMRLFVHYEIFRNAISMLGSEEQKERLLGDIDSFRIFGCFAMTELGHSSSLKGIETTAIYDNATDEFIIDSPSITSTKWWIGLAGQTATHCVAIAQTIINGKKVGLNWFIVQLRSKNTGELEPGVQAGDMGEKAGFNGLDNGWIQFRQKRIMRTDMLAKWASLDHQGNYKPAPNPAVMYATLIPERLSVCSIATQFVTRALTVTTRYSVVRRQGIQNQQIMDYQSHYTKLIPAIAFMFMIKLSTDNVNNQFKILTSDGKMNEKDYLNHMGELHAISSSFKGFTGWYTCEILEECRRCCGGHAFSAYNSIGQIISAWGVMTTGGGDNVVLLQQAARYLVSRLENQFNSNVYPSFKFKSSTDYIMNAKHYLAKDSWPTGKSFGDISNFSMIWDAMNTILVKRLYYISKERGNESDALIIENTRVAQLHCAAFMFGVSAQKFEQSASDVDPSILPIMRKLTLLWGIHTLYKFSDQGFKCGYFAPSDLESIEQTYFEICKSLRNQVIGLTDAFDLPDFILKAPIGKYDGNIYSDYFDTVLSAPKSTGVPPYHLKYIIPLTEDKKA